jgi:hypothetical protein
MGEKRKIEWGIRDREGRIFTWQHDEDGARAQIADLTDRFPPGTYTLMRRTYGAGAWVTADTGTAPRDPITTKARPAPTEVPASIPDVATLLANSIRHAQCWDPWPLTHGRVVVDRFNGGSIAVYFTNEDDARTFHTMIAPACNGLLQGQRDEAITVLRQLARAVGWGDTADPHEIQRRLAIALWTTDEIDGGSVPHPNNASVRLDLPSYVDRLLSIIGRPLRRREFRDGA